MKTNFVRMLIALAMVCSLVGAAIAPAVAQNCGDIGLSALAGNVGDPITVDIDAGVGEWEGQPVSVEFAGVTMATQPSSVTVDENGDASCQIQIPASIAGEHTITVTVGFSDCEFDFEVLPEVSISPDEGEVGSSVTVSGTGFGWDSPVSVDVYIAEAGEPDPVANGALLAQGVLVNADGSFSSGASIPPGLAAGSHDIYAVDGANNEDTSADAFLVKPIVTVSPGNGLAGSDVTVEGAGWDAGGGLVDVSFGAVDPWVANIVVQPDGSFEVDTTVPVGQGSGSKAVEAEQGVNVATSSFTIDPRQIILTPSSGPMGTEVRVQCEDLTPNGEIADGDLQIGGVAVNDDDITINSSGTMSATEVTVPDADDGITVGQVSVTLLDSGGLTASAFFTVTEPNISVSPLTGPRGDMITVQGSGWVPDETVTVEFVPGGEDPFTVSTVPDANGNFGAALEVPTTAQDGDDNVVRAWDGPARGDRNEAEEVLFTVPPPAIELSPTSGVPGMDQVTVTGSGFGAYTSVTITFGTAIFADQPLTDRFGGFTYTATVPGQPRGSTMVTAATSDDQATEFFDVQAAPDTVSAAMASISDYLVRVWGYFSGDWEMYDPADTVGSDLLSLTTGRGYWVKVDTACTLIFGGSSWELEEGFNNIGWM
jgi:hypothetical protein